MTRKMLQTTQQQQRTGALAIVGPEYCASYPKEYVIQKKVVSFSEGDFTITDTNGNLCFKVDGKVWSMREKRVLTDALSRPLVSMKRKYMSLHSTWWAYLGKSTSSRNDLYTIKQSSVLQFKTSLNVFLARSNHPGQPDFTIKGDFLDRRCQVYYNNQVVAEVKRQLSASKLILGRDTFSVLVYPGTDSAFIVSLIVLMDAIHHEGEHS